MSAVIEKLQIKGRTLIRCSHSRDTTCRRGAVAAVGLAAALLLISAAAAFPPPALSGLARPASAEVGFESGWRQDGLPEYFMYDLAPNPARPGRIYAYGGLAGGKGRNTNMNVYESEDGGPWANLSHGNIGRGLSSAMAVDESGAIYVSDLGSIHISRDDGSSWDTVAGPPGEGAMVALSTDPPTLYTLGGLTGFARSYDGGETWDIIDRRLLCDARSIAADAQGLVFLAGGCGVLRSKQAGASWSQALYVDRHTLMCVALDPLDSRMVYAGGYNNSSAQESANPEVRGLWQSTDGGDTWEHINNEIPIRGLRFDERDPAHQTLLALGDYELFWSADGGATWTALGGPAKPVATVPFPRISDFIASGNRVLVATNGDGIWSASPPPLPDLNGAP